MSDTGAAHAPFPPATIRRRLRARLAEAFRSSGSRAQVFLDMFAGSGKVARGLQRLTRLGVVTIELKDDPACDMTNPAAVRVIRGWISSRVARGVFLAPPCSTWSMASHGHYRRPDCIYGRPDLPARARLLADIGNSTLRHAQSVIRACLRYGVPVIMENPLTSMMWSEPVMMELRQDRRCVETVVDYCQHGTKWRKSTRFVSWNCTSPPVSLTRRCGGCRGLCSRTGLPHQTLQGSAPGGARWTALAEPYPAPVATGISRWLQRSADRVEHCRVSEFIMAASMV